MTGKTFWAWIPWNLTLYEALALLFVGFMLTVWRQPETLLDAVRIFTAFLLGAITVLYFTYRRKRWISQLPEVKP